MKIDELGATADRVLLKRCFFRRREDGDTLNTPLWPRARRGSTGRRAEVPSEDIAVAMPNEPHRQARELGTGGVRTSLRGHSLGRRKGTQRRRRAWSRVRLNNSRWLRSSPSPGSSSHRHRSDDFLVFFLIPKSILFTGEWITRGVTSASAAPWSTRSLAQPRTVPLLRGTDHFPLRSNSKSGNTDYASFG